jgi:roadblock/LC7 domain-containing protein
MSRVTVFQSDFSGGALDPLLLGRIDLQQYARGLEQAQNVIVLPQGGFERRPGTRFMLDLSSHLGSGISPTTGIRLIPFEFSTTQSYMLAFVKYSTASSNNVRMFVYANKVQVTAINGGSDAYLQVSMGDIDLSKLNFTQSADTLILVHEDMAPISIVRGGTDATWTAAAISLTIPKYAFTLATTQISGNVTPSATSGSITLTSAGTSWTSSHVDQYFTRDDGFGRVRIVEFVSTSEVIGVVEVPFLNTTAIADSAHHLETGYEDAWSASKGYPRSATFHEGRLYFGGSKSLPNTLWGSKVNDFYNFKQTQALDDDAINATLSSDRVNAITGLFAARDLQIFTTGGEFFVQQTEVTPITPTNLTVKSATKNGSKEGIRPVQTADATLFIDRNGGGLRELLYNDTQLNYNANNISFFSSHLIKSPLKMAMRQSTDTDEGDLLLIANGTDGTMACFSVLRPINVVAASEFVTDGEFLDVAVDITDIYTVVKRTLPIASTVLSVTQVTDSRTFTITVSDYSSIEVGTTLVFSKHDGTEMTLEFETAGSSSPSSASGNTHYVRAYSNNATTADNIYTAINAMEGFTVTNPDAAVVTVTRDDPGNDNQTVTASGPSKYYLELFDSERTTDCNLQFYTGSSAPDGSLPSNTSISGVGHLERKSVKVLRDGFVLLDKTVASGALTLDVAPSSYVEVGLDYTVSVKTLPAEPNLSSGPVQSRKRRIMEVTPILKSTQNVSVNGFDVHFRSLSDTLGTSISAFSGRKRIGPLLGYSETAQITFSQSQPLFMTVLSVEYKLSTAAN